MNLLAGRCQQVRIGVDSHLHLSAPTQKEVRIGAAPFRGAPIGTNGSPGAEIGL